MCTRRISTSTEAPPPNFRGRGSPCKGVDFAYHGFHMSRTLPDSRRGDKLAWHPCESSCLEFILLEPEFLFLVLGYRILSGERREGFDLAPHIRRRKIHNTVWTGPQIRQSLRAFQETKRYRPTQRPERRDWRKIRGAIRSDGTDQSYGRSEVEDLRADG